MLCFFFFFFCKSTEPIRYTHREIYCRSWNLQSVSWRPREPRSWWYKLQLKSKARENQTPSSKVYLGLQCGSPGGSMGKESTCNAGNAGDKGSIPGSGRSLEGGHGNPLQYSCLENPMDKGAWWATVHRVTKRLNWACLQGFKGLDESHLHSDVNLIHKHSQQTYTE